MKYWIGTISCCVCVLSAPLHKPPPAYMHVKNKHSEVTADFKVDHVITNLKSLLFFLHFSGIKVLLANTIIASTFAIPFLSLIFQDQMKKE